MFLIENHLLQLVVAEGVYFLEGKTLEEVTKMRFQAWRKHWEEKYQSFKQ